MRPAFSLPEVLAAIIVFAIGILGLASSGTFIAIQAREARAITEGAILAGRVLDSLRSRPCTAVGSGQLTWRGATVRWTATPTSRSVAVDATMEIPGRRGGTRQWNLNSLLPCER
jgi:prepilin-type N-terminal cleavage/methylation domain-containing protein